MRKWIEKLQRHGGRWWYAPLVGFLALADHFVVVIPTDGLLVTSTIMAPRRWIFNAAATTVGSAAGAMALAWLVREYGNDFVIHFFPTIHSSGAWKWTEGLMEKWGAVAVFLVALSPFMQHPAVIIAGLISMPYGALFGAVFLGRAMKYLLLSWVASHAPEMLNKIWGIQGELQAVMEEKKDKK